MENSDFDKFIQSNTQKELNVPDGLDWENMNIPLPEKKRKKRFFFLILWGMLGLVAISGVWAYFYITESTTIHTTTSSKKASINKEQTILNTKEDIKQQTILKQTDNTTNNNNNITKLKPSAFNIKNNDNLPPSDFNLKPIENSSIVLKKSNEGQSTLGTSTIKVEATSQPDIKIPSKPTVLISNIRTLKIQLGSSVEPLLNIDLPIYYPLKTPPHKKKMLLLSFGLNSTQSNYKDGLQTEALTNAEEAAWGTSFQVLFQYEFKKELFSSFGLGYHRLHNTFTFREDLGSIINSIQQQKIYQTRYVFYNNFFDFVELKIGGGKNFSFGNNWGSQIAIHINPSYKVNSTGRTLNDGESIITIEDFDAQQKLFWNASADWKLFYKIKGNNIFVGASYARSLNSIKFLENSDLKFAPQILNLNLGVSRRF